MRISEDASSWRARGILCRDFRHTHDGPEVDTTKVRRKKSRSKKQRPTCKHVWVQVDWREWYRYANRYWYFYTPDRAPHWARFSTHYVCAGCLATKRKHDKTRERIYYRREYAKRQKERTRAS